MQDCAGILPFSIARELQRSARFDAFATPWARTRFLRIPIVQLVAIVRHQSKSLARPRPRKFQGGGMDDRGLLPPSPVDGGATSLVGGQACFPIVVSIARD